MYKRQVPILDKDGKYVGSITEGDLLWGVKKMNLMNIKEAEKDVYKRQHQYSDGCRR